MAKSLLLKDPIALWKVALAQLEVKIDNPNNFKAWLENTKLLNVLEDKMVIGTKNIYASDWIRRKYSKEITGTIAYLTGKDFKIEYKVDPTISVSDKEDSQVKQKVNRLMSAKESSPSLLTARKDSSLELEEIILKSKLNLKYSFGNFVVGESNKFAHAAALKVAENPGTIYNPFFVYGHTGLGKTHLAHATARKILEHNLSRKVVYVSAEEFMNEMVSAIRSGKNNKFREKFRESVDILIIDDIQFISQWDKTKEELFNTINSLQAGNKQIIIISDRTPEQLEKLPDRLLSRFQGGIVVDVGRPDLEMRKAILSKKAGAMNLQIEDKLLDSVAKAITDNVRELEGALQKVLLLQSVAGGHELTSEELSAQLGKDVSQKRKKFSIREIINYVAKEYDIAPKDIKGNRRTAHIALARQVCMYILRSEFNYRLEEIAKFLGKKDHTTIMHGVEKISLKRQQDDVFRDHLVQIVEGLGQI